MKRVLIFGGTFNPFHEGHRQMVQTAYESLSPDEVWLIPAGNPPHKTIDVEVTSMDRMEMIRNGVSDLSFRDSIRILDKECRSPRLSYTYQTLEDFRRNYPDDEFIFLIGEDSLDYFDEWRYPERITACASIAVCGRDQSTDDSLLRKCKEKEEKYHTKFYALKMEHVEISSSQIRSYIFEEKENECTKFLHKKNLEYIRNHRLYRAVTDMNFQEIEKDLKKRLKPGRYEHTLGVMYTCGNLAMRYSYPMEEAMLAGLLHDCAKYHKNDEFLDLCHEYGISITESEKKAPHLLHAKLGAYYAKKRYHVKDEGILHAISVHTTGVPNMNLLDQILFVADYIEPNRDQAPHLKEIRNIAYENLQDAVIFILNDTLSYLETTQSAIDETTQKTYDFYVGLEQE